MLALLALPRAKIPSAKLRQVFLARLLMAERLLLHLAKERGLSGWEARSGGIMAETFFKVPRPVRELLRKHAGVKELEHKPRLVTEELMDWADWVFTMEEAQKDHLADLFPKARKKIGLLDPTGDIEDPIGKEEAAYEACFKKIAACLNRLLDNVPA